MAAGSRTVVVTGGSGASGIAMARAFRKAGHTVYTVGSHEDRIKAAAHEAGTGVVPVVCDLSELESVRSMADAIRAEVGGVDAVIHLVGGWRGATGIEDQTDDDWEFLEDSAVTTLRNVTRVFYRDLADSPCGRFAMVSSTAVANPTAGGASYVAAKAAAEAWTMAMAEGFRSDAGATTQHSAASVFVVAALVDEGRRLKHPDRTFPGHTDVEDLAAAAVELFERPAEEVNGQRLILAPE